MIKVIGFDIGEVILNNCWNDEAKDSICNQFNVTIDKEGMGQTYERQLDLLTMDRITEDQFFTNMIQEDSFNLRKIKTHLRQKSRVKYPEVLELLPKLKNTYQVVLMTNEGKAWNNYRIKKFKLHQYVHTIFSSCEMNQMKPNKNFFRTCLKSLQIKPNELLFIDNAIKNINTASSLGIQTIHFKNPKQLTKELLKLKLKMSDPQPDVM